MTGTGTGAFTGNEVTLVAGPYVAADLVGDGPHVDITVSAEGRNKDSRADDDVKDTIHFHVDESLHDGGAWVNAADGWKYCYADGYCARSKYVTIDGDTYYFNGLFAFKGVGGGGIPRSGGGSVGGSFGG